MSVRHFDMVELARIALVLDLEPADLALVSEANTKCYRDRYRHLEDAQGAEAATEADIRAAMVPITVTSACVLEALSDARMLHYNCQDDRDYRTEPVLLALGRITHAALALAMTVYHPFRPNGTDLEHVTTTIHQRVWSARNPPRPVGVRERVSTQSVYRTGKLVQAQEWREKRYGAIRVGDAVCEVIYEDMMETLPPVHMSGSLLQTGEGDITRYATLQRYSQQWIYTGEQPAGVLVTIK